MIWNCGNCGAELEEGTNFCPSCGTKINWETSQTDQTFTCGNCGGEFNGKVGFCPHCGSPIIWDDKEKERLTLKQKIILLIAILISIVNSILYFNNWISNIVLGSYIILAPLIPLFIWLYKDEIKNNLNLKMKHTVYCYFSINIVILVFLSSLAIYDKVNTNYSPQESEEIAVEEVKVVEKESEAERQAREQKEEAERNPYAEFVGTYQLYDNDGGCQFSHFMIKEDGRFCKSIVKIFMDEGRKETSEWDVIGKISSVSDNIVFVQLTKRFYLDGIVVNGEEMIPWTNKGSVSHCVRYKEFSPYSYFIFDISTKKMYPNKDEYDNRDLKEPLFYKFRYSKQY